MPFGLCTAPGTFQRTVNLIFADYYNKGIAVYIDDIVVYAADEKRHLELLEVVLTRLKENGLFMNLMKSWFGYQSIKYLGIIVDHQGIQPDPDKIRAVKELKVPHDISSLRRFLGSVGYFRRFIAGFAQKASPLTKLLRKDTNWMWEKEHEAAWRELKDYLTQAPIVLTLPHPEWKWILDTDASGSAIAGVLQQEDTEGRCHVVSYASKTLSDTQRKWTIRELEAFAIVWATLYFAEYLRHKTFVVRTDHESLRWLWKTDNKRIARWALALQEFNMHIEYRQGKYQQHVDIFTRDVEISPWEDSVTDRIALTAKVATVKAPPDVTRIAHAFPSVEVFKAAQASDENIKRYPLVENKGLWYTKTGKVFVPESLRRKVLYFFHFGRAGGHQGINRTFNRLSKTFWWKNLKNRK